MEIKIARELLKFHIMPNRKGYTYFKEALSIMREKDCKIDNYVQEIYDPIAMAHSIGVAAVIKAMTACMSELMKTDENFFSDCVSYKGRVSLKEFLLKLYFSIFSSHSNI